MQIENKMFVVKTQPVLFINKLDAFTICFFHSVPIHKIANVDQITDLLLYL